MSDLTESAAKPLPHLGEGIEVTGHLACGRRTNVYTVLYRGRRAVAKFYRPEFIRKYRKRFDCDIAEFEYERNRTFHASEALRPYCPEPLHCIHDYEGVCVFIQEYIEGDSLSRFAERTGYLPEEIMAAGYFIVSEASRIGLHDLDIYPSNVLIVADGQRWKPMVYDFNMMPQHKFPPNPIIAAAFLLGLRKRSHRDYANLKKWQRLATG